MDFEHAARRFAREQQSSRSNNRITGNGTGSGAALSVKAKREAELRKKEQVQRLEERRKRQRRLEFLEQYMRQCDRSLGVKSLLPSAAHNVGITSSGSSSSLQLQATSIHGEGDKIALPPSVLEYLTRSQSSTAAEDEESFQGPWTFRIGILNPKYDASSSFPASPLLQTLKIPNDEDSSHHDDDDDMDTDDDSENDEEKNVNSHHSKAAYLDELNYKYLSYTHGTVVEFTQDENCVGLPQPIAMALLASGNRNNQNNIPITRTVDPAAKQHNNNSMALDDNNAEEEQMNVQDDHDDDGDDHELTPGHLAYGAFDIPDLPIEISLVQLPKGRACTLTPTVQAVQDGFYNLKNIKLVLEQSLIRTRATLSMGDTVHTWHRGVKYDLTVSHVTPSAYKAIRCINTDLEVDFGHVEMPNAAATDSASLSSAATATSESGGFTLSGGRVLSSLASSPVPSAAKPIATGTTAVNVEKLLQSLPEEPPAEQSQGVCTVQIRGSGSGGKNGRRRFHVEKTTVHDLFTFAKSILAAAQDKEATIIPPFRLVTRMPRRVLEDPSWTSGGATDNSNTITATTLLSQVGIQQGQQLFMIEFQ